MATALKRKIPVGVSLEPDNLDFVDKAAKDGQSNRSETINAIITKARKNARRKKRA